MKIGSRIIIDRIPYRFCEGPFWGNGRMGAVMYIRDGKVCFSIDHVGLWELRETLPDEPRASFQEIIKHKKEYLDRLPEFVAPTDIFKENIGRTRLPSLAIELVFSGKVTDFCAETDLSTAQTVFYLQLDGEKKVEGCIRLDSCVNILYLELRGEAGKELQVNASGWDLESPRLSVLKNWNYQPCVLTQEGNKFTVVQYFGGEMTAVLCGKQVHKEDSLCLAVDINVDGQKREEELVKEGSSLAAEYLLQTERYRKAHEEDWEAFWSRFGIEIPNERLQESFEQEMYKLYCNEREDSMPITLQGIWNPDNRMPAWYGDLHNDLNVQSCYWPAYKTGNVKLVRPYVDYYTKAVPRFEERAWKLFGIKDAVHVPTMMAPNGTGAASEWCYWNTILGAELFVAVDFTWFYEYSQEEDTLRNQIYPFIEKVLHLYQGIACEKDDEYLHIPFTFSPEVKMDGEMLIGDDSTFTLSCLHYLCRKMAVYAQTLGKDGNDFLAWECRLMPVTVTEKGFPLFKDIDVFGSHRHFCHMFPIFPLCEESHNDVTNASLDAVINQGFLEYAAYSFPYMGIFAARCGRGNMCRTMLELYCMAFRSRNSFTVNGDPYQNGLLTVSDSNAGESADAFTLESGFFVPTLLCEMFVHRTGNDVWLMMGIPDEWKTCKCYNLTIEGGHSISVEWDNYHLIKAVLYAGCNETLVFHCKNESAFQRVVKSGEEMVLEF